MDSNEQLLSTAQSFLLTPHELEAGKLDRVFGSLLSHKLDYADLYFQYSRSEGWSLEEGIVKSGSFSIDQGVGVRAVAGEKTAFAYSDDLSETALLDAARTVRSIASADSTAKVALLERTERMARDKDPRVAQVMAGLAAEHEVVLIARADGT